MTIDRMRQEIKIRWNKINSNHKKNLPTPYLDDIINDAISEYIEMFYSGSNPKKFNIGFEVTQQRIDMLSTLVVPHKSVIASLVEPSIYNLRLFNIDPKYRHFLRGSIIASDCNDTKIPINIIRHNDFDAKMMDDNTKPSLIWKRCLGLFKQDIHISSTDSCIYLYVPEEITGSELTCEIEYIRKPAKVFSSGYDSLEFLNGDTSAYQSSDPAVHCDLPEDFHTVVVEISVQLIAAMLEDNNKFQFSEDKIFKNT